MNIFAIAAATVLGIPVGAIFLVTVLVVTQPIVYVPAGIALGACLAWPLYRDYIRVAKKKN